MRRRSRFYPWAVLAAAVALGAGACMPATIPPEAVAPDGTGPSGAPSDTVRGGIPGGFGTLRQEQITLSIDAGEMQVKLTPLAPEIVRLAAPDTWRRLAGIRDRMAPRLPAEHQLFLISFFTEAAGGAELDPRDVILVNRSRRYRPVEIAPLTPGWGAGRVQARRTEQAVYAFSPQIDLEMEMGVEIAGEVNRGWGAVLPRLEAERARVRARAGSTGGS